VLEILHSCTRERFRTCLRDRGGAELVSGQGGRGGAARRRGGCRGRMTVALDYTSPKPARPSLMRSVRALPHLGPTQYWPRPSKPAQAASVQAVSAGLAALPIYALSGPAQGYTSAQNEHQPPHPRALSGLYLGPADVRCLLARAFWGEPPAVAVLVDGAGAVQLAPARSPSARSKLPPRVRLPGARATPRHQQALRHPASGSPQAVRLERDLAAARAPDPEHERQQPSLAHRPRAQAGVGAAVGSQAAVHGSHEVD